MDPKRILGKLRRGETLDDADMSAFANGLASGEVSDAQGAAFAMAVCKAGLSAGVTASLTRAMRDSGHVLRWDLPGPVLDKHSTGGLGDATSLVIAPMLAALGAYAPFLSGRGLGHTGGTLDKLEAIAGVSTDMSEETLRRMVTQIGCAIVGASAEIAPADQRLYALRDHTSTVDSQELITASILSKKLATGADAMVLDVKGGTGAFMKSREDASALARSLVEVANAAGTPTRALITDMNQPLAPAVGNAVEIAEVLNVLTDPQPQSRLCQLSLVLCGELMVLGGMSDTAEAGARRALDTLHSGHAAEKFAEMVHGLGGPTDVVERSSAYLPAAGVVRPVYPDSAGVVAAIDGTALGQIVLELGGGRRKPADAINPAVGLTDVASLGQGVGTDVPLAMVHAADEAGFERTVQALKSAFHVAEKGSAPSLIHDRVP
ncbi:thymidine phosphorylase [Qingshengfaniella alkalisoli]|uniref:thymidine phosphorylase n=1 Tax=Qingshengfaniella alkalisoli TaxID=2599296 RepID=A0A5B8I7P2_9RHOB|nr:thymidine phosphorylase [Qingshengfaniella alkalisoli]QDY68536.1 thymidine phosphorylase [Qingshengfaniella alkalisoli]